MAEKNEAEKSLEMRVAELENKLKGLQVTEEEMKAYNKVAAMLGGGGATPARAMDQAALTPVPDSCIVSQCTVLQCTVLACTVRACTIRACTIRACTIRQCCIIQDCINECGGGCAPGGGGFMGGGGFGTLGG